MFDPKTFRTNKITLAKETIFNGPVDGSKKLPSIKKHSLLDTGVLLVGYPDKKGCFSYRETNEAVVYICFYPEASPKELTQADLWDGLHAEVDNLPGWGFGAIHSLKARM